MSEVTAERVRLVRARAGLSRVEIAAVLEIAGDDRASFLQTQLPVDVTALAPGVGVYTAYLDRRGRIDTDLVLFDLGDVFWALLPRERIEATRLKLESFHFRERVTIRDRRADLAVLELHGPDAAGILAKAGAPAREPFRPEGFDLGGGKARFLTDPWTGDAGGRLVTARTGAGDARAALDRAAAPGGLAELDEDCLEILRIEGGRARFGVDMDGSALLAELDRPEMVSHRKGCYLGQETVARVHSRGRVNRLWRGLLVEGTERPRPGDALRHGDVEAGEIRSAAYSPSLDRTVALAWVRREAAAPGTVVRLRLGGRLVPATVAELPLHRPRGPQEVAEELYREGMGAFTADRFEDARRLFERALLMNPAHPGALESLGVSQERLGRLEEAVETMQSLAEAVPEHVMAWTNLSRYHARLGRLEEAERIKGHVSYLVMKRRLGEREAESRAAEDRQRRRAELEERVELFRRVLELDPADVVANFGLGRIHMDLERFAEAEPCFRRAIEGQKDYSMAFSHLGACLVRLGRTAEAAEALRAGIEAARRRGDLIPLGDMTRLLEEVEANGS